MPVRRLLCAAAVLACTSGRGSTTDPGPDVQLTLVPTTPTRQLAPVGGSVDRAPAVRLVDARTGRPHAGTVTFATQRGDSIDPSDVPTGAGGTAASRGWAIGGRPGTHALGVASPGASPVAFEVVGLPRSVTASAAMARCPIAPALVPELGELPRAAAALGANGRLTVVAIGSSTTQGVGASTPAHAYPAQLEAKLRQALPLATITVLNRGVGGDLARQSVARFERDVFAHDPDLVVWQTGTNDLLQNVPIDAFELTVAAGVSALRARGIDVVVMDSQRFPLAGDTEVARAYQRALADAAERAGAGVLPRYAWMTELLRSGRYDFGDLLTADGLHMNDMMHDCVAHYAAIGVIAAMRESAR